MAALSKVVAEIEAGRGTATPVAMDLRAPSSSALVEAALQAYGGSTSS